jgi:L-fuconolactonase
MDMPKQIDAHHHLWKYSPDQFPWIGPGMDVIRRDFVPEDLQKEMSAAGIQGSVAVQARQTMEETEWLLRMAERRDFIAGVVGWLPLREPSLAPELERFAGHPKLKGLRHVIHDEPDDDYILGKEFDAGIDLLGQFNLAYDILVFEKHLPQTIRFVDRHPNQLFVLDHIAKPRIRDRHLSPWRENLTDLSKRSNVYCKLSGVVTEADWANWKPEEIEPYMDFALKTFGPERLMFGSDWPVLLLASSYSRWIETVRRLIGKLSVTEQEHIMGLTAAKAYGLFDDGEEPGRQA